MAAAEESVGRAAEPEAAGMGERHQLLGLLHGHAERLFRIDMLAGEQRLLADRVMRGRRRQVDDQADLGIVEHLFQRGRLQAELSGELAGRFASLMSWTDFTRTKSNMCSVAT